MSKHGRMNISEKLRSSSSNISKHITCQVNPSLAPAHIITAKLYIVYTPKNGTYNFKGKKSVITEQVERRTNKEYILV